MTTSRTYEALAESWAARDRPAAVLLQGTRLMVLQCWCHSAGAKKEGVSDRLREFLQAGVAAQPAGWLDELLDDRGFCSNCGERYRLENLGVCTACLSTYCHRCETGVAANGNKACTCGGEIVG